MRRALLLVCLVALAGCANDQEAPGDADPTVAEPDAFVLAYRIVELEDESRSAEPGHHCGDAARTGDELTIWLWPEEEQPDGPWLAIFPTLPDGWHASIGEQPFKTSFPATVDPRVQDDPTILGELEWQGQDSNGTLRLDGQAVSLPHSWSVTGDGWRADAELSAWDKPVRVERHTGLCD